MDRRTFLAALAGGLVAAPFAAGAQQAPTVRRIGVLLYDGAPPGLLEMFREGLQKLGYVEGQNISLELRDAGGKREQLGILADELVRLKVETILAVNTPAALAVKKATSTIPIVITRIADPVRSGLVASLARPGGNVTGLSFQQPEEAAKRIELFREIVPGLSRLAVLFNANNPGTAPNVAATERVGRQVGVAISLLPVRAPSDFPGAFQAAARARAQALDVNDDTALTHHRAEILALAAKQALPVGSIYRDFAEAGGLFAYGPYLPVVYRRAAYYVDRILRGAKPSDLPVEQPTKLELVINLKAAKALGLTIPQSVLLRADEVIQ
jgi:putative ABC transport system substrate-binding protein